MGNNEKREYEPPKIISTTTWLSKTSTLTDFVHPERQSSEAVRLLRNITENVSFNGGTDYVINEKHIREAEQFLENITD